MKRNISRTTIVMIVFAMLCVGVAPAARAQSCSLALTAGKWAFTSTGTVVGVGPRAVIAIFTLDAEGNVLNGKATASLNGVVTHETFSGTYTVNPDCTGNLTADVSNNLGQTIAITANIIFDGNVQQIRILYTSAIVQTTPPTPLAIVITGDGRRLFPDSGNQP